MTTKAIKPKKVKINIMGEKFKVEPKVNEKEQAKKEKGKGKKEEETGAKEQ